MKEHLKNMLKPKNYGINKDPETLSNYERHT